MFPNDLHRTPPNDPRVPPTLQSAGPRVPTHHLGWTKHHCEWHFCWTVKFSKLNLEMFFPKKSPLTNSTPLKSATSDKIPSCKVTHRHWKSRIFFVLNTINKWWVFHGYVSYRSVIFLLCLDEPWAPSHWLHRPIKSGWGWDAPPGGSPLRMRAPWKSGDSEIGNHHFWGASC